MIENRTQRETNPRTARADSERFRPRGQALIAHCSLLVAGLCGFLVVFGAAHLLLIRITKPSGYLFFGTLVVAPLIVAALLSRFAPDRRVTLVRFGFGALMCALAIPFIYLARFAPEHSRATVRNLLGLPFFVLALVGPFVFRRRSNGQIAP